RDGGRDFSGVDVTLDPERRLVCGGTRGVVGHREQPDVPSLVALANRFDVHQTRILGGERLEDGSQFSIAVEAVESYFRHGALRGQSAECGGPGRFTSMAGARNKKGRSSRP